MNNLHSQQQNVVRSNKFYYFRLNELFSVLFELSQGLLLNETGKKCQFGYGAKFND